MQELVVAVCLVLVIEGVLPFLAPEAWRRAVMNAASLQPRHIRLMGLASMLTGVFLLYVLN